MSQYITLDDRLIEYSQAHRQVVRGALSKLALFQSSLSLLGSHKYMKQKVSLRMKKEEDRALTTHEQSLHQNYAKLKHNLQLYARSKSLKLEHAFERQSVTSYGERPREDVARLSCKSDKEDRTVFIERKYNCQFAISTAIATEMTAISEEKVRMRKLLNERNFSPLARQARNRMIHSPQEKNKENPVLAKRKGVQLRKKKKLNQYSFVSSYKKIK